MGAYIDSPEILTEVIITDPDDYFAISDDLTRVNEQKEKMYELYENMPTLNKGNFVALLQKAHGHDSDYAKDRVEKWCEEYEIFDYAPIDEKTVTQDNFAELADELIDTERNEADLVNQLFATAEEEGEDTMSLEDVAEVLEEGGLIRTATHKTAGKKLQEYDERYGMTSFRYVDKGAVYLSTYAPSA
ncbi:hypothetical protein SAMN05444422_10623 [Halobiforma haloterrestris]|uniref:Uncharacterized protein n=2 Tax=Natronobacterium haloterrestre TaxID=148448 RepID=A0A1I1HJ46_NATHA|nr:hypothetical protein SAMN05444422_10623 [Halobiforma haloterrestris]